MDFYKKSGAFYDFNRLKVVTKRGKCDATIFLTLRHPLYDLKRDILVSVDCGRGGMNG